MQRKKKILKKAKQKMSVHAYTCNCPDPMICWINCTDTGLSYINTTQAMADIAVARKA